jgi:hypothetical protein
MRRPLPNLLEELTYIFMMEATRHREQGLQGKRHCIPDTGMHVLPVAGRKVPPQNEPLQAKKIFSAFSSPSQLQQTALMNNQHGAARLLCSRHDWLKGSFQSLHSIAFPAARVPCGFSSSVMLRP